LNYYDISIIGNLTSYVFYNTLLERRWLTVISYGVVSGT